MDKKIEVGHLIRVFYDGDTFEGIVVHIDDYTDNEFLPYVSLKVFDATKKETNFVCVGGSNYKDNGKYFSVLFVREIDENHLETILNSYKKYDNKPEDIKPNTQYNNGIEIYVKTKKDWFTLLRTTAKMAFFDGGRCALGNITDIRKKS